MTRSRLRPYLSSTTRVSKASPRSMWKSLMYPSSLRTRAISAFIRDEGMVAVSWSARFAFRIRVSMSETGSVSIVPPLPARLGHAGDEALVRKLAQADPAEAELLVDSARAPAPVAPGVGPRLVLLRAGGLRDQALLGHTPPTVPSSDGLVFLASARGRQARTQGASIRERIGATEDAAWRFRAPLEIP